MSFNYHPNPQTERGYDSLGGASQSTLALGSGEDVRFPTTSSNSSQANLSRPQPPFAWNGPSVSSLSSSNHSSSNEFGVEGGGGNRYSVTSTHPQSQRYEVLDAPQSYAFLPPEKDDALHDAGPLAPREGRARMIVETNAFRGGQGIGLMGCLNLLALVLLCGGLVALFGAWPVISFMNSTAFVNTTGYISGTPANSSIGTSINSNAPNISARGFSLIDPDTPTSAYTKTAINGEELELVFSDEFNEDGRYFFEGLDPYWETVNLHYWQTEDLEWYDPESVTTEGGSLVLTLSKETLADSHDLGYLGGMIQSWNKFCFTGGRVETRLSLPGNTAVTGLWPSVWTMGNLGRAGYGASLDGTWPYTYETCDIGTLPNQTSPSGGPAVVTTTGDPTHDNSLSYLPGQKLSSCTCPGEDHPGPRLKNGSYTGRSASEIDLFEATITDGVGQVSQSAQYAPFNPNYYILNDTTSEVFYNTAGSGATEMNTYFGGVYQQAVSAISSTDQATYNSTASMSSYGIEYQPSYFEGTGTGYIKWLQSQGDDDIEEMWMLSDTALAPNLDAEIGQRPITGEPLYIIANLGMSPSFTTVQTAKLTYPAKMRIDYIRVYQSTKFDQNVGCNPPKYPTTDYINNHPEAYNNQNLTTWQQYIDTTGYVINGTSSVGFPKNRLLQAC